MYIRTLDSIHQVTNSFIDYKGKKVYIIENDKVIDESEVVKESERLEWLFDTLVYVNKEFNFIALCSIKKDDYGVGIYMGNEHTHDYFDVNKHRIYGSIWTVQTNGTPQLTPKAVMKTGGTFELL